MTYSTAYGFGDAASDYSACLSVQAAYNADLAAWNREKAAYDVAVKARAAKMAGQAAGYAAAMASYQANHAKWAKAKALHDQWAGAMSGKYASYARSVAALAARFPGVKLAAGAPSCVTPAIHTKYAAGCEATTLHGLGAYDWSPYNPCFIAAYPVCTPDPVEPPLPGPEPQPPSAPVTPADIPAPSPKPSAPSACVAPTPVPTPVVVTPAQPDLTPPLTPTEADVLPTSRASGGLLMVGLLAAAAIGGIYLVTRRKRAA